MADPATLTAIFAATAGGAAGGGAAVGAGAAASGLGAGALSALGAGALGAGATTAANTLVGDKGPSGASVAANAPASPQQQAQPAVQGPKAKPNRPSFFGENTTPTVGTFGQKTLLGQ